MRIAPYLVGIIGILAGSLLQIGSKAAWEVSSDKLGGMNKTGFVGGLREVKLTEQFAIAVSMLRVASFDIFYLTPTFFVDFPILSRYHAVSS